MIIERNALPGIGTCHVATTARRQRIGVVAHRSGRRDLIVYDADDPQRAAGAVVLDADEAHYLAGLLCDLTTIDHLRDADPAPGRIAVAEIRVPPRTVRPDHPLHEVIGDGSGAYVVAVIRGGQVIAAPGPAFILEVGDALLAAGDHAGIAALAARLDHDTQQSPLETAAPTARAVGDKAGAMSQIAQQRDGNVRTGFGGQLARGGGLPAQRGELSIQDQGRGGFADLVGVEQEQVRQGTGEVVGARRCGAPPAPQPSSSAGRR